MKNTQMCRDMKNVEFIRAMATSIPHSHKNKTREMSKMNKNDIKFFE